LWKYERVRNHDGRFFVHRSACVRKRRVDRHGRHGGDGARCGEPLVASEAGCSILVTSASALLAALSKAETDRQLSDA
jgi:hypothetical protein